MNKHESGFTYLAVLILVAILGTALAATGMIWSRVKQRENERELLHVGSKIRLAIGSYYEMTPGIVKRYPLKLHDLLKDNRRLTVTRHLRRIYIDPITLKQEWGIIRAPDGGIKGVYSLSESTPIKKANFAEGDKEFKGAKKYSDWHFYYEPQ